MASVLHLINPLYTASGFAVGALVGFTGVGGGSLMTPLLVLLFGIHPATAVGTDLLYAGLTKICGTAVHGFHSAIDWRVTRRLALGSIPAAALTLWTLSHFGVDSKGTNTAITTTLGFALILTAVTLVFRARLLKAMASFMDGRTERQVSALTTTLGATLGVLVSISSVGAGAIGVTALLTLYPKMPTVRIVGSDIAHAVPLDADRGNRPLVDGLGRLAAAGLPAHRVDSRNRDRQPFCFARAGARPASVARRDARPCRRKAGLLSRTSISPRATMNRRG